MTDPVIVPVIMSGGAGTRLWPLSRKGKPKQLHAIFGSKTLLQETALRVPVDAGFADPIVVCAESHIAEVTRQLTEIGSKPAQIIAEPVARNTAPCAMTAALAVAEHFGKDALVLLLAADHLVSNPVSFRQTVKQGVQATLDGKILTFGPKPTRPETGYGYLLSGQDLGDGVHELRKFVEKPNLKTAKAWVKDGRYLWNAGMFLFRADIMQQEMQTQRPEIAKATRLAWERASDKPDCTVLDYEAFANCPSESVDNAVMEHTEKGAVIALDAGWSDVGSWAAIHELSDQDEYGNACQGNVVSLDNENCLLRSDDIHIAATGLQNLAIIAQGNSVLILPLQESQKVKDIVALIPKDNL
jgi:mannose-1-phosphate guanylyltransferase/mannose-6-phosphate isomerase